MKTAPAAASAATSEGDTGADSGLRGYLSTLVLLALACVVVVLLEIEQRAGLPRLVPVIVVGFAIHARAPLRLRPALFVLLSTAGMFAVLGVDAGWVVGLGVGLFGLCSLQIKIWARSVLVLAAAVALALFRANGTFAWAATAVPVVSAMFMFRAMVFLFDENASGPKATVAQRAAYFFMLPNVCFPLFPVVDYKLWRTRYYHGKTAALHRKGMAWISRGLVHLVLYRVVYHFLVPPDWEVVDSETALLSMATVYPLYLRISGQFHFITGVLCLFGYDLPETNHRYFFASSFLDLWRRVNIYWKDFIEKIFFYPFFLRLRRMGAPQPMVLAIALTFVATWILHSYQWFWLRGDFPLTAQDAVFWALIGVFVAVNSVMESKRKRRPRKKDNHFNPVEAFQNVTKVVGMMSLMTLLWSFWSAQTLADWTDLLSLLATDSKWLLWVGGAVAAAYALGMPGQYLASRTPAGWDGLHPPVTGWMSGLALVALLGLGLLPKAGLTDGFGAEVLGALTTHKLNEQDRLTQVRGYYETLLVGQSMMSELATADIGMPDGWITLTTDDHSRKTDDLRNREMLRNHTGVHRGATFSTNRWGMRDKDYDKRKPARTYRIALLGSSYAMGSGVEDKHVFERLVEDWLNNRYGGNTYDRYEILNFSQEGNLLINTVGMCVDVVPAFEPDLVILIDHAMQPKRLAKRMSRSSTESEHYPKPWLAEWLESNGVEAGAGSRANQRAMWSASKNLPQRFLADAVELCSRNGARSGWLWLPVNKPDHPEYNEMRESQWAAAVSLGMVPMTLDGAYGDHNVDELSIAAWDEHPNALGHRLLADALIRQLEQNDKALGLGLQR